MSKHLTRDQIANLITLYKCHQKVDYIAFHFGIATTSVARIVERNGYPLRGKGKDYQVRWLTDIHEALSCVDYKAARATVALRVVGGAKRTPSEDAYSVRKSAMIPLGVSTLNSSEYSTF